jgi:putative ABC transport system permease protein
MFWQDVRFGIRLLRKSPGFTVAAIAALALGIGANTAVFSIVDSVLIRPLPYPHAERMAVVWQSSHEQGWDRISPSGADFVQFKRQTDAFEQLALFELGSGTLNGMGEPMQAPGLRVTTNFFSLFGARPMLGRDFSASEGWQTRVAILSYGAWTRLFNGDPNVIGKRALVDGIPYTTIGVMPKDLWLPVPADLFVPWSDADLATKDDRFVVVGRLGPGVSFERASAQLRAAMPRLAERDIHERGWSASATPLQEAMVSNTRPALLILLAAVAMVLLIACTNLANLLLARASSRGRESAIRTALGASRGRLVRQFLTETLAIALIGGAIGLLLALWGVDLVDHITPQTLRLPHSNAEVNRPAIAVDGLVFAFTAFLSMATAFVFGLAPALAGSRTSVNDILSQAGRGSSGSARGRRARSAFVVAEVALALMLLICAGLMLKSFWKVQRVDPGFRPDHVLAMDIELPTDSRYKTGPEQTRFFERVLDGVRNVAGVRSAGVSSSLPLDERDEKIEFEIEGRPLAANGQLLPADLRTVSEDYLGTMGIPLRRGRGFEARDTLERPRVAIIDETLAEKYWPPESNGPQNPIGQRIRFSGKNVYEIVGITGAVRNTGLDQEPRPTIYLTYRQVPDAHLTLVVRHPNPAAVARAVKGAVYAVDREQPVFRIRTMDAVVAGSESGTRFTLLLLAVFAAIAALLAGAGIYGLISYAVARRAGEIGIRMALGATGGEVVRLVVREGMTLAGVGVACGLGGAILITRFLRTFLFEVSPTDVGTFAAVCGLVAVVSLAAAFVPAWRATRIDPVRCLRYE